MNSVETNATIEITVIVRIISELLKGMQSFLELIILPEDGLEDDMKCAAGTAAMKKNGLQDLNP